MRPMLPRLLRAPPHDNLFIKGRASALLFEGIATRQSTKSWTCRQCQQLIQGRLRSKTHPAGLGALGRYDSRYTAHDTSSRALARNLRHAFSTSSKHPNQEPAKDGITDAKTELPSQEESRRSHVAKRFSHVMDNVQSNIFIAGQRLNDLTGYSGIEALKNDIEQQGMYRLIFLITHTQTAFRGTSPSLTRNPSKSPSRLHNSNSSALRLTARSQRAPSAQARLVTSRPRALHHSLPLRPRQRSGGS